MKYIKEGENSCGIEAGTKPCRECSFNKRKMSNLKKFKVKFFGSKNRKEQIKQVKNLIVEAPKREAVEDVLRHQYGYEVINGLKIHDYEGE